MQLFIPVIVHPGRYSDRARLSGGSNERLVGIRGWFVVGSDYFEKCLKWGEEQQGREVR